MYHELRKRGTRADSDEIDAPSVVIAGLVPAISNPLARPCHVNRDHRDKPGDDECGFASTEPIRSEHAVVLRFRSSHHFAAPSRANFGIKGALASICF